MRACFQLAFRPRAVPLHTPSLSLHPQRFYAAPTSDRPSFRISRQSYPPRRDSSDPSSSDPLIFSPPLKEPDYDTPPSSGRLSVKEIAEAAGGRYDRKPSDDFRVVPASASYFTALPRFTDDLLGLEDLLRKCTTLPVVPPGEAPRVAWLTYAQYTASNAEPIRKASYAKLVKLLQRLNQIHPALIPDEVTDELKRFKRAVQPNENVPKPIVIDALGRARAVGRRKTSSAVVWLVEGDGEVRVNGRKLTEHFGRLHDRESAIWALKATERVGKYNVWATVAGGGTTGQAEAITLGLAKALLVHEPALKPALRRAGCVTRDPRRVERKKTGKLKARKMPAWVKR
ncbi:hypothetical protein K461DRAFT_232781 [Myriangium duriaei CBS 260.36]|uniref:Small ribosomal subunit protein uS9m n=1 Tax=Myriangium duriaei CBS 260.36 TaxID=1168546 RepID=A0A9P4IU25_9PEZI|nr:hypothetical protein K461DRAFT_232781 [Myriangium duriaei CBS 260.36]